MHTTKKTGQVPCLSYQSIRETDYGQGAADVISVVRVRVVEAGFCRYIATSNARTEIGIPGRGGRIARRLILLGVLGTCARGHRPPGVSNAECRMQN